MGNSPQTYTGLAQAASVSISASSVPGAVANILTGGAATQTNANTYAVTADFVPTDSANYNTLTGLSAGNFVIEQGNTEDPVGKQLAGDLHRLGSGGHGRHFRKLGAGRGQQHPDRRRSHQTNAGTYAVTADFVPTDTANYNSLTGLSAGNFVINKATPTAPCR